ncbi:protein CDV3 homolog isoform X2 [Hetaerina americana]|uniref:protein CDV3 homolog isoform X2 n=1 Tax=Hetaerina americana TaxID=62018 RepID=UPI003A7F4F54
MADLDDFFAKKDKRKAKGKKFTTADEIAKKLEETGKKTKDTKKEKEKQSIPVSTPGQESDEPVQQQQQQEDDEWKEFEEEKKDYSGLKIQNLQLSDPEEEGEDDEEEEEHENEAGEKVMRKKVPAGPWKMPQPEKEEEPVEEEKEDDKSNEDKKDEKPAGPGETGGSTYRAPHLRHAQQPLAPLRMRAKTKTAPDINSEEYFPTLSASKTAEPAGAWGKRRDNERGFEEVRNSKSHSSRGPGSGISSDLGRGNGSRLPLGNKYGALDQS